MKPYQTINIFLLIFRLHKNDFIVSKFNKNLVKLKRKEKKIK